ncbi:BTB/POZ-like [Macleaya cordata]|uniref:BTB/POZ-like n=1 Tax=Macleaya cordata TaxID=56857 RepID=A0A200PTU6_MACCD|nr:BTB/POZ-like [Macleaya cordata]
MDLNHHHQQLCSSKCSKQRCNNNEWIFLDVRSDITIEVDGAIFPLHKFPLVSRSGRIRKLVAEHRDTDLTRIELLGLPGGVESFELAAKFCYGVNFEITSSNVAQLCCISDYLEMTEEYAKDNLGFRAETYLDTVVCKSLEMCVQVLKQCENLLPLADELKIVSRCTDAIASKTCAEQIASSFSRLEYSSSGRLQTNRQTNCDGDWWIEDLSVLRVDLYQRVITAMRCRGVRPESIGASLIDYAQKVLMKKSNLWNSSIQSKADIVGSFDHVQRLVVETIVSLLPVEKLIIPISFLFGLLRTAMMLDCASNCRLDLERRIASQLEMATLDDLLIPSFRHPGDTLFDVDTVHRILVNFSQQDDSEDDMEYASAYDSDSSHSPCQSVLLKVAKLVDNYLAEIAADANLKFTKFMAIAETLPEHARTIHDGLYRAIDIYLKAHQGLSDPEKRKICKLVDFEKLSQEAGAHAAQNERLPLQSIVQVLYFEQLRLRNTLCCSYPDTDHKPVLHQSWRIGSGGLSAAMSPRDNYASLRRENRELKLELTRLRMRLNDLEKDHVCMKKDMEKSSSSHNLTSSFSWMISKLNFFGHSSSRGSSLPSKHTQGPDSKMTTGK